MKLAGVILAAGKGTRLGDYTKNKAKPSLLVGGLPIVRRVWLHLKGYNLDPIVVNTSYLAESVKDALANTDVTFLHEEEPAGTAGILLKVKDLLTDPFFVVNGDTLTNVDLAKMHQGFKKSGAIGEIFTHKDAIHTGGVYLFSREVLSYIPKDTHFDIDKDLIPKLVAGGEILNLFKDLQAYYIDCGTPSKLDKARRLFSG